MRVAALGAPPGFAERLEDAVLHTPPARQLRGDPAVLARARAARAAPRGGARARWSRAAGCGSRGRSAARASQTDLDDARCASSGSRPGSSTTRSARSTRPGRGCASCAARVGDGALESRLERRAALAGSRRRATTSSSSASKRGVAVEARLELAAPARRRERDDLVAQVAPAALESVPSASSGARWASSAVLELRDAVAARARRSRAPAISGAPARRERQHAADLAHHRRGQRVVGLVDDDHVGDLHHAGLQRLHRVARAGHEHEHDGVGVVDDVDLAPGRRRPSRGRSSSRRRRPSAASPAAPRRRGRRARRASPSSG